MRDPAKLRVLARATEFAVAVYRLAGSLPSHERFGLASQMRRAAVSVGSNIAQGCGRRVERDCVRFLDIARGSTSELAFQLTIAEQFAYGSPGEIATVREHLDHVQRMLKPADRPCARQALHLNRLQPGETGPNPSRHSHFAIRAYNRFRIASGVIACRYTPIVVK